MNAKMAGALRELERTVRRLEELAEWEKLAQQEHRPGIPPGFEPDPHLGEDIREAQGRFWTQDLNLRQTIQELDASAAPEQLAHWNACLHQLEQRVRVLRLGEIFIYC